MVTKTTRLETLCNISIGRTPSRLEQYWFNSGKDSDWPWLSIKDMGVSSKYVTLTSETITFEGQKKFNIPIVKKGTVLVSFKLTVGRVSIAGIDMLTNEAIAQLPIINNNLLDKDFLYYYLKTYPWNTLGSTSSIATAVNSKMIKAMEITYPADISIQRKIASILSSIDEKIDLNNNMNAMLEEKAESIFKKEIARFDDTPDEWKKVPLDSIADFLNGLAMQKYPAINGEPYLPVLKIAELKRGFFDASSNTCTTKIKPEYYVYNGDVIFSWSASLVVDFWCGGTCGLNQHLFKVTSKMYDKWFYYMWTKYYLSDFVHEAASKATTMGHITRDRLNHAKVLIPDNYTYNRIGSLLTDFHTKIISNRLENKKLLELRDALLPKLMSGEIDVDGIEI